MRISPIRYFAATVTTAAAVLVAVLTTATPASAAPSCNTTTRFVQSGLAFSIPSASGDINCILGVGNQGAAVRHLQSNLNLCYYSGSTVRGHRNVLSTRLSTDGIYGNLTRNAVAAVQRSHSISDDGVYGPQTRRTILWIADDGSAGRCAVFGR